ncbi:uncharacterized protein LOC107043990 [Diachasma alloeum]|uniref:uncharacterized protein LOC107043990 n=1 Tax=Diachasma alloeum TaxID=454923 RepID=UPI00073844BA|nr:uncharacterized protein LOC107043990 [Diachasma alloeum]
MKLFIFLRTLRYLFQIVASFATETEFYAYTVVNSEIREKIQNVSTYMYSLDLKVQNMSKQFHWNVSSVRSKYGFKTYLHFKEKYEVKADEFAKNLNMSKECSQYVGRLLEGNEKHRIEISEYLGAAVDAWREGLDNLYKKFANIRVRLGTIEMEACRCATFYGYNTKKPFNCAMRILDKGRRIDTDAMVGIGLDELPHMVDTQANALTKLHRAVRDKSIPFFYDEKEIDNHLANFCSG